MTSCIKRLNAWASIAVGIYFTGVFLYLMKTAVLPLTMAGEWRGPADIIVVSFYLAGIVPLLGIALIDLSLLGGEKSDIERLKLHSIFVALFLVVAHVAMIFGMLNPELLGYTPTIVHQMAM